MFFCLKSIFNENLALKNWSALKKTRAKISSFDFRFEISMKNWFKKHFTSRSGINIQKNKYESINVARRLYMVPYNNRTIIQCQIDGGLARSLVHPPGLDLMAFFYFFMMSLSWKKRVTENKLERKSDFDPFKYFLAI